MSSDVMNEPDFVPVSRWEGEAADPSILAESFRFPYACNVVAQNRFMKSAMSEQLATFVKDDMAKSGIPTDELINLYKKFGEGGYGIIVTGCITINGRDIEEPGNVIIDKNLDTEERREAFKKWTSAGKANGSLMIAQLLHPGKYATRLTRTSNFDINTLTRQEIQELIEEYTYAAKFAQECGFDGVEIASAFFYTLGQFLTDGANTRTDEFGGSLNNRSRLLFSIMQKLRMKLPRQCNFVFGVKFYSGNFQSGYSEDDFCDFVHNVEKTGFDYVAITGGHYNLLRNFPKDGSVKGEHFYQTVVPTMRRNLTRTKLYMNGNFVTLSDMCDAVKEKWATGISLGKPVAAEPNLPKKMLSSKVRGAVKSLIDPVDFLKEQVFFELPNRQLAGTQLWQHSMNLEVTDPSNPMHIDQFNKCLAEFDEMQLRARETKTDKIVGYPRLILKGSQHYPTDIINIYPTQLTATSSKLPEKVEKETHEVEEKDLKGLPDTIGLHKQTIADSFSVFEKRFENDGNVEIIEESYEKVTTSNVDYVEPQEKKDLESHEKISDAENSDEAVLPEEMQKGFVRGPKINLEPEKPEEKVEGTKIEVEFEDASSEPTQAEVEKLKKVCEEGVQEVLKSEKSNKKLEEKEPELTAEHADLVESAFKAGVEEVVYEAENKEVSDSRNNVEEPTEKLVFDNVNTEPVKDTDETTSHLVEETIPVPTITTGVTSALDEAADKPVDHFTDAEESKYTKDIIEDIKKETDATSGATAPVEESTFEQKKEKDDFNKAETKETRQEIVTDITSCKKPEEANLPLPSSAEGTEAKPESQEIIAGITADNQEIIVGLQTNVEHKKESTEAPIQLTLAAETRAVLTDEAKPEAEEAKETSASATAETFNEEYTDAVEEKFEKVILENISLAGLISDLVIPSTDSSKQETEEIIAGITSDSKEVISGLVEKKDHEEKEKPSEPEISLETTVQLPSSQPESDKTAGESEVSEKVAEEFKDVKQWLVITKKDEPTPTIELTAEPEVEKKLTSDLASEEPKAPSEEFKDVKQWLVFTKKDIAVASTKSATESLADQKAAPTSIELSEKSVEISEEFKNVKQWLVFTKNETEAEPEKLASKPLMLEEKSEESEFKDVKQWLVFNKKETSELTLEQPEESATEVIKTETISPNFESQFDINLSKIKSEFIVKTEFQPSDESPNSHKELFGASVPKEEGGKPETSEGFFDAQNPFEKPKQFADFMQEQFADFNKPLDSSEHTTFESMKTFEETVDTTTAKPEEKKSGGFSGFFKSAFTNPVQKLFSDTKEKVEEPVPDAHDEYFDVTETTHHAKINAFHDGGADNDSSLKEVITGTSDPFAQEVAPQQIDETIKTTSQLSFGPDSTTTTTTVTKTRTQKKRSSKYSKKDRKGFPDDHSGDYI